MVLKKEIEFHQDEIPRRDEVKKAQLKDTEYKVVFSGLSNSYCIGIVDMVNSTRISADMNELEWCQYYGIFLNSMARILPKFGGKVIKNQGDSLLYYFPESNRSSKIGLMNCIESTQAMIESHDKISEKISEKGLPRLDYRISLDYGKVVEMESNNSCTPDLIGPPVNMCAKMNHLAKPNGAVIGGDLYQNVKEIKNYQYIQKKGISIGLKFSYPIYEVVRGYRFR